MTRWLPVVAGLAGALYGGWLVGRWCFGLVLIVESVCVAVLAFPVREAARLPRPHEKTLVDVLEYQRRAQLAAGVPFAGRHS
jgi:hypothetical protein